MIRVLNFLLMEGRNVNTVVIVEVQGELLSKVLERAGVVETF